MGEPLCDGSLRVLIADNKDMGDPGIDSRVITRGSLVPCPEPAADDV
jgi:hypothetical protein